MPALLLENWKITLDNGAIVQIRIWQLEGANRGKATRAEVFALLWPVAGADHRLRQRSGQGDHRHYRDREETYRFSTFERLLSDFWRDVTREIENERG